MKLYIRYTIIIVLVYTTLTSFVNESLYEVRAYLIYNVAKNITFSSDKQFGDFIVGVDTDNEVLIYLQELAKHKTINGRKLIVKSITNPFEVIDCNVIVIPNNKIKDYNGICYVGNVLLFGYGKDAIDKGAHVACYLTKDNKPRLTLSVSNMLNCNITPNDKLVKLINDND